MTTRKIAVSVPDPVLQRAKKAVARGDAASLSAYVTDALVQKTTDDDLRALLDEMLEETGGRPTTAERRAADARVKRLVSKKRRARRAA